MNNEANTAMHDHCIVNGVVDRPRAMIIYVEKPKLYIGIIDGTIYKIQRAPYHKRINPHAIVVETFDAAFGSIHVADNKLYLDGFALTDLMAWLYREQPAKFMAFCKRTWKLFPNSFEIAYLLRAVARVVTDREHEAHGEEAYFCAKVREAHPVGFAELRAAWKQRQSS
ncbi:hypothetical protein [Bradyrhizobium brasilense]|uniref:GIY-YIG nuclease family protein n=1 Tax=Bradyrhizobium brasilense TaxID=1419277 RepID=A0ABY8JAU3_9BRAD|nr:hypothetical protein [Bradyrhizobium brasilense]WFU62695.1 hypothetical protein QA636_35485 [Bradyrhizobium brasilense]